jgi:hypothetical protein
MVVARSCRALPCYYYAPHSNAKACRTVGIDCDDVLATPLQTYGIEAPLGEIFTLYTALVQDDDRADG